MVVYFTGTGNSRFVAERIAMQTGDKIVSMKEYFDVDSLNSTQPFVFVVPIYAWGLPMVVMNYIKNVELTGNNKVYIIVTCGATSGVIYKKLKGVIEKKGLVLQGFEEVVMPSNYVLMSNPPSKEESFKIIKSALPIIDEISMNIKSENSFSMKRKIRVIDRIQGISLINTLFHKYAAKDESFYATDSCIGCGECAKECPLSNITMEANKPKWNGNCTHCMCCIGICKYEAVVYKGKSEGRKAYYLPADSKVN